MLLSKFKFVKDLGFLMSFGNIVDLLYPSKSNLNNALIVNSIFGSISSNLNPPRINIVNFSNTFQKSILNILRWYIYFFESMKRKIDIISY